MKVYEIVVNRNPREKTMQLVCRLGFPAFETIIDYGLFLKIPGGSYIHCTVAGVPLQLIPNVQCGYVIENDANVYAGLPCADARTMICAVDHTPVEWGILFPVRDTLSAGDFTISIL